jgi:predicted enzyme involved in methoxymalonyl-ACP biosynthesis
MIDTYLLSCRGLGRGVEFTFLSEIIEQLKNLGLKTLKAVYFPTAKNDQVSDYYDKMNFRLEKVEAHVKYYTVNIDEFIPHKRPYIKTHHGK